MNGLQNLTSRKTNCIGHVLRRICLLKHVIEIKIEGRTSQKERRERRRRQLLYEFKEKGVHWILREVSLDRTEWRTRFGS